MLVPGRGVITRVMPRLDAAVLVLGGRPGPPKRGTMHMAADKDVTLVIEQHGAHREVHRLLDQFLFKLNHFEVWVADEVAICHAKHLVDLLDKAMRHIAKADTPSKRADIVILGEPKAVITDAIRDAEQDARFGWAAWLVWGLGSYQERIRKMADGYLADGLIGEADLEEEKPTQDDDAQQAPATISFVNETPAAAKCPCPFRIDPTSGELQVTTPTGEVSIKLTPKERECMRPIIAAFPSGVSLNNQNQVPRTYSNHIATVRRKLKGLPNDIETPGDSGKGAGGLYRITAA
jgi:hypothetical protein